MRLSSIAWLVVALVQPMSITAQTADDPRGVRRPWQWSDDERIAARLDPSYIAKHLKSDSATGQTMVSIDGRENPQLFLPFELFNWLMRGLTDSPESRPTTRAMISDRLKSFGYNNPDAFWAELETAIASHVALVRQNTALRTEMQSAGRTRRAEIARQLEASNIPLCRSRADALAAARAHFGRENFDRLLYSVVATHLSVASPLPSADEMRGLAYLEGGCR